MVTAVISDLHLGTRTEADLLRRPEVREKLMTELEAVDHVVLLGDTIELRDGRPSEALDAAAPFFDDLGEALSGRRVTLVAGNHDYQLASPWLMRRRAAGARAPLGLEHVSVPEPGDPVGSWRGEWARPSSFWHIPACGCVRTSTPLTATTSTATTRWRRSSASLGGPPRPAPRAAERLSDA